MQIKISTFNVNSIKARLERVKEWIKMSNPDVILLQEIKCLEQDFPYEDFFDLGYNAAVSGQKSYNGVAILSKYKIEDVIKSLPSQNLPDQARYIEGVISVNNRAIRVASIYVPNGGGEIAVGQTLEQSEKFIYKLNFLDALNSHFKNLLEYDEITILGGDYNVGAEAIDVYDPKGLEGSVCFHNEERKKFRALLNAGYSDAYRAAYPNSCAFTWWDYRGGSWQHNKGLRIDYLLTSPQASDKVTQVMIEDKKVRDKEKASDHCPVSLIIEV